MASNDEGTPFGAYLDSRLQLQRTPSGQPPPPPLPLRPQQQAVALSDDLFGTAGAMGGAAKGPREEERHLADFLASANQFPGSQSSLSRSDDISSGARPKIPGTQKEESTKIKKWREDMKRQLEEKDRQEELRIQELRQNAQRELAEWYERYHDSLAKRRTANRSSADWLPEGGRAHPDGSPDWDKVARLCGFNAKPSGSGKDVSRMRGIIQQLQQQKSTPGSRAPPSPSISN
ncbi:clathrin light chain-like [Haemaphysalis longicornis]